MNDKHATSNQLTAAIEALQQQAAWILMMAAIANAKRSSEIKS